jgi:hypothetical protein
MPRLKVANNARSKLTVAIDTVATSFTVEDSTLFPVAPFRITVNTEIMEVGAVDTLTHTFSSVIRGQEGTTATSHVSGDYVENRWTQGTYDELIDKAYVDATFFPLSGGTLTGSLSLASATDGINASSFEIDTNAPNMRVTVKDGRFFVQTPDGLGGFIERFNLPSGDSTVNAELKSVGGLTINGNLVHHVGNIKDALVDYAEVIGLSDTRITKGGTWTATGGWGFNKLSSDGGYSATAGYTVSASESLILALDNNQYRSVVMSHLDWNNTGDYDVYLSNDGGTNYAFHKRIHTYNASPDSSPYTSSLHLVATNLTIGSNIRVKIQAVRGRIHFEGFGCTKYSVIGGTTAGTMTGMGQHVLHYGPTLDAPSIYGVSKFYNTSGQDLDTDPGQINGLQVYQPSAGYDALMSFHVGGDYAVHFGLDGGINDLVVGGWSMNAKHTVWHHGNHPKTTVSSIAPSSPRTNDIWVDTSA